MREGQCFSWQEANNLGQLDSITDGQRSHETLGRKLVVFQVVSGNLPWKKHVSTDTLFEWRRMEVPCMIQHYAVWSGSAASGAAEVYEDGHPEMVDLMALATWRQLFAELLEWRCIQGSDIEGCWRLSLPSSFHQKERRSDSQHIRLINILRSKPRGRQ